MTLHLRSYRETNSPNLINFHEPSSSFSQSSIGSQTQTQKSKAKMSTTTLSSTKYLSAASSSPATSRTASPKPPTAFIHHMDMTSGSKDGARFEVLSDAFKGLIGQRPHLRKLLKTNDGKALFHEAGIYLSDSNTVILSSNRFEKHGKENGQYACIVHLPLDALPKPKSNDSVYPGEPNVHLQEYMWKQITVRESLGDDMILPNGATRWVLDDGREGVLWCEQGKHDLNAVQDPTQAYVQSALVVYDPQTNSTVSKLDSFEGKRFSSLNDVVVHQQSGAVFFTDPDYGVEQLFKRGHDIQKGEHAYAPNSVYCWQPKTGNVTLLDSDYVKPNGCTFVPDPNYPLSSGVGALVTTDTGRLNFKHISCPKSGKLTAHFVCDKGKPACIYAYPVNYQTDEHSSDQPFVDVKKRQLVAHSTCSGAPDGIHPDEKGNVWAGHGDGVHAYSIDWSMLSRAETSSNNKPIGKLIGKIKLPDGHGVANFCWAGKISEEKEMSCSDRNRMLLFAEDELWEAIVAVNGFD